MNKFEGFKKSEIESWLEYKRFYDKAKNYLQNELKPKLEEKGFVVGSVTETVGNIYQIYFKVIPSDISPKKWKKPWKNINFGFYTPSPDKVANGVEDEGISVFIEVFMSNNFVNLVRNSKIYRSARKGLSRRKYTLDYYGEQQIVRIVDIKEMKFNRLNQTRKLNNFFIKGIQALEETKLIQLLKRYSK